MTTEQQEELKALKEIRHEWVKKRNAFRLAEAKNSDTGSLHTIQEEIKKADQKIEELDNEIKSIEVENSTNIEIQPILVNKDVLPREKQIEERDELFKAIETLKLEGKELGYTSTKEDIAKIHNLKTKVYNEIFKTIEEQMTFVTSKSELMYSSALFDIIYTSETIDTITVSEIQKIREDNENFKWYDRSVIVSALSLSLLHFKFETKKANLLLDFVTDFEPNVWERALTGLTLAIIYQNNRTWMRDNNFINRLRTLQNNDDIQEGIKKIDFILKNELYKENIFNPKLFEMDLFKSPMNCFVPFFDENSVLKNAIENAPVDFNVEEFQGFLKTMPLMDINKYALCVVLADGGLKKQILEKNEESYRFYNSLTISDNFSPFQNLISEYFCFFNFFPKKELDNIFEKQLLITKTDLRTIILNKTMQLLLEANRLYEEDKYNEAISKYQSLLKIEKSHNESRWQLAACYEEINETKKAIDIYLELEKELGENVGRDLLFKIANCYNELNMYSESIEYCKKIEQKVEQPSLNFMLLVADNYEKQSDYVNGEKYYNIAEKMALDEDDKLIIAERYFVRDKYSEALRIMKEIIVLPEKNSQYWLLLGKIYCDLFEWDLSIETLIKANELDKEKVDTEILMSLGRSYILSNGNIIEGKKILENLRGSTSTSNNLTPLIHGNLAHAYLIEGDREKALYFYSKCIKLLKDEKDFAQRMGKDLKFILKMGITEDNYNAIRDYVIKSYLSKGKR